MKLKLIALLIIVFASQVGRTQDEKVSPPGNPYSELKGEAKQKAFEKAKAEHDAFASLFSDLSALRFQVQQEIGKAKKEGSAGTMALIQLRRLLKEIDTEIAAVQELTMKSMSIVRILQPMTSVPMVTPKN